jgi:hypothetical protein
VDYTEYKGQRVSHFASGLFKMNYTQGQIGKCTNVGTQHFVLAFAAIKEEAAFECDLI